MAGKVSGPGTTVTLLPALLLPYFKNKKEDGYHRRNVGVRGAYIPVDQLKLRRKGGSSAAGKWSGRALQEVG